MIRAINTVERNVQDQQLPPIVVPAGQATDVLPSMIDSPYELAYREIFNAGGNNVYYAFGSDADNVQNYKAYLVPGQMLEIATKDRVSCYSVGGTTISRTVLIRKDMEVPNKNIL